MEWERGSRIITQNYNDAKGRPAGGYAQGPGFHVIWQNGPEKLTGHRGAHVEDLIDAVIARLQHYQEGEFKCLENSVALDKLHGALLALEGRTRKRMDRGVEGTHEQ